MQTQKIKTAESNQQKNAYDIAWERAADPTQREQFWAEAAERVTWFKKATTILDQSNPPFYRWFKDAELNICYNAVDRHQDQADKPALICVSNMMNTEKIYTWKELLVNVSKLAGALRSLGVQKGDRVIIFSPVIAEAIFSMLAVARLGAIHSVVFGGFASKELASRISDSQAKVIITASCGLEPHKIIDFKEIVDDAIKLSNISDIKTIVIQREKMITNKLTIGRDFDYYSLMQVAQPVDCVPVKGEDPLYILYTSGTTGQPKGIVRDCGGTAVILTWTMEHIKDIRKGDTYFSGSDIGWVVGHCFTVYGPLLQGAATVLYEGKPTHTPNPGAYWKIVEKYKVNGFYTAPTAIRALRKEDPDGEWIKKYNVSSLKAISFAGERCDIPTYQWLQTNFPGILCNDQYWQTETGYMISCNYKNLHQFPLVLGSCTKPCPGMVISIVNEGNKPIEHHQLGKVAIRLPLPPSFMLTLWNNDNAFKEKYLTDNPGFYTSGDAGFFDENGFLNIMTRLDDIINTAGHRLSTAQMEEVLLGHNDLVEAAVVSEKDALKGEIPVGFVVIKIGHNPDPKKLETECIKLVRDEIGPVAAFRHIIIVDKLPKTRSGKILRHILKKIVDGEPYKVPPTIEDDTVLEKIEAKAKAAGFGVKVDILYKAEDNQQYQNQMDILFVTSLNDQTQLNNNQQ